MSTTRLKEWPKSVRPEDQDQDAAAPSAEEEKAAPKATKAKPAGKKK